MEHSRCNSPGLNQLSKLLLESRKEQLTRDCLLTECSEGVYEFPLVVIDMCVKHILLACGIDTDTTHYFGLGLCIKYDNSPSWLYNPLCTMEPIHQIEGCKTNLVFIKANHAA